MVSEFSRTLLRVGVWISTLVALSANARTADKWFTLDSSDQYPNWREQVQELVDSSQAVSPTKICVVGVGDGDASTVQAYVIWRDHHRLITWIPSKDDPHSLANQTRVLNLETDVVASDRQVAGSTYLVTRPWLHDLERHCRIFGTTLTLSAQRRH